MKKVITYGTFDLFHQGHYNILKRAKEHGDYLIVGVTSESYDIERGKLNVRDSLLQRIENVKKTGFADEIIIEEYQGQKVNDIIKYNVDTLVIGSDWRGKFDYLKNYCDVVYLERTRNISSTMLRGKSRIYKIGVVTDNASDNGIVLESKYVSGIHVECVYSSDITVAEEFCGKYELDSYEDDYDVFLDMVDIVYIKTGLAARSDYMEQAIRRGKYIICDSPFTMDLEREKQLMDLAVEKGVVLVEKIMLVYLRAFNQLVWMSHGDLIGDIVSVKCSVSQQNFKAGDALEEVITYPVCAVLKLLGKGYEEVSNNRIVDRDGSFLYDMVSIKYKNALATIEIGSSVYVQDELVLIGKRGRVTVPNDWWNTGYYEAKVEGQDFLKRFSFNFEGNGFRYLLQELLIMINDNRTECTRLFYEESAKIVEILGRLL